MDYIYILGLKYCTTIVYSIPPSAAPPLKALATAVARPWRPCGASAASQVSANQPPPRTPFGRRSSSRGRHSRRRRRNNNNHPPNRRPASGALSTVARATTWPFGTRASRRSAAMAPSGTSIRAAAMCLTRPSRRRIGFLASSFQYMCIGNSSIIQCEQIIYINYYFTYYAICIYTRHLNVFRFYLINIFKYTILI